MGRRFRVWTFAVLGLSAACSSGGGGAKPASKSQAPGGSQAGAPASMASAAGHAGSATAGARDAASRGPGTTSDAAQKPLDSAPDLDSGIDDDASHRVHAPVPVPPPMPSGCVSDVSPGRHSLDCDGISHDLSVPEACLGTQCGLILDVHGGTMSGKMEDNNTNMAALGKLHGYVVVQPNAANGLFDASTDDDKVLAFAKTVIAVFHLDEKRVHMTGFSQGGYMTWRFICHHTDFLASAAPAAAAGAANISLETDCSLTGAEVPSREIDILYMHGTKDALVDFQNGLDKRAALIAAFGLDAGTSVAGDATYRRTRYQNAKHTIFEFIDHDYISNSSFPADPPLGIAIQGHCYPGSQDLTPTEPNQLMAFGCQPPTSFTWGEEVMAFFLAHESLNKR